MTDKLVVLALDTSGDYIKAAFQFNGKTFKTRKKAVKQERYLLTLLDSLLSKAKLTLKDVNIICVLKGPGRFTGIRIGLTFASIMQNFNNSKVFSVDLLSALAFSVAKNTNLCKNAPAKIAVVLHAFRDEYYLQFFTLTKNECLKADGGPLWLTKTEAADKLKKQKHSVFLCGWGENYQPLEEVFKDKKFLYAASQPTGLDSAVLIKMVNTKTFLHKNLKPLYLKKARFEI